MSALIRPLVMGIVNVTPDSFSDGGRLADAKAAIAHGLRLIQQGADILDIGGESTQPGAEPVGLAEELDRVLPVIEGLAARTDRAISIDTTKPEVAEAAVAAGASMWNDVSALAAPGAAKTAAHNLTLVRYLDRVIALRFPVLFGASRKRTIQAIDPTATDADDRLGGSLALALEAARAGARAVRVHDVRETVQALKLQAAIHEG